MLVLDVVFVQVLNKVASLVIDLGILPAQKLFVKVFGIFIILQKSTFFSICSLFQWNEKMAYSQWKTVSGSLSFWMPVEKYGCRRL